jgi:hypothetical protein
MVTFLRSNLFNYSRFVIDIQAISDAFTSDNLSRPPLLNPDCLRLSMYYLTSKPQCSQHPKTRIHVSEILVLVRHAGLVKADALQVMSQTSARGSLSNSGESLLLIACFRCLKSRLSCSVRAVARPRRQKKSALYVLPFEDLICS